MVLHETGVIDVNGLTPDTLFDEAELEGGNGVKIPDPLFKLNGDGGCDPSIGALRAELDGWFLERDELLSGAREALASLLNIEGDDVPEILVHRLLIYVRAQHANTEFGQEHPECMCAWGRALPISGSDFYRYGRDFVRSA